MQEPISNICKVDVNFVVIGEHLETYAKIRYKSKSLGHFISFVFVRNIRIQALLQQIY